ncbi:MAG: hypothetical protein QHH07_12870, partial [Sedimentisphaerales bacterium]|nr:hypothetical protein [Sedimentisphaerales bacterium]
TSSTIRVVQSTLELVRKVPMEALLGEPIPVEYTITNSGSGTAQDVRIIETLPAGLSTTDGRNEVRIDVGQLGPGQTRTFSVQLQASKPGTFTSQAKALSSSNAQALSAALPITVRRPVLAVRRIGPERVYLGRTVTYELQVENQGDGTANEVVLEELIPAGVVDVQTAPVAILTADKLTWNLGSIPPRSGKAVRVSYRPTSAGILTCTSTANAKLADATSSTVRVAVVGIPTLRLDVIDLEDPVEVKGHVTYVITVTNEGSATDRNIQVVCELDDNIDYLSCSGPTQGSAAGRTVNLGILRTLGPNEKTTWRVVTRALRAGPVRFKASLTSESLSRPVEETEATFLYE